MWSLFFSFSLCCLLKLLIYLPPYPAYVKRGTFTPKIFHSHLKLDKNYILIKFYAVIILLQIFPHAMTVQLSRHMQNFAVTKYHFVRILMRAVPKFNPIWIIIEKLLMRCVPDVGLCLNLFTAANYPANTWPPSRSSRYPLWHVLWMLHRHLTLHWIPFLGMNTIYYSFTWKLCKLLGSVSRKKNLPILHSFMATDVLVTQGAMASQGWF